MSIIEDPPLSVEAPAVPVHTSSSSSQANFNRHMGTATLEGITFTRHYVRRAIQDVIKPAIKTFLDTCETHPRIAAVVATPALLGFLLVLVFFIISTLVLVVWSMLTITSGVIFVIIVGVLSLFLKLLVVVLATLPLAAIATGLLVGANTVSQSMIRRMPQNNVGPVITQTVRDTNWKSVIEHMINLGKKLGPGSAALVERLLVLKVALHNFIVTFKSGIEDLRNAGVESLHNDTPNDSTAKTTGEPSQNRKSAHETQTVSDPEYTELQRTGSTEGLKRWTMAFPRTSEDVVDEVLVSL